MGSLKGSVRDTRPGEADHKGSEVPNELRDIVVEKIEEIGGGKVKEVSRTRQLRLRARANSYIKQSCRIVCCEIDEGNLAIDVHVC